MASERTVSAAIDGPAGAGKSTIARACAKRLGFVYCDTGALYRAVGLYCLRNGGVESTENIAARVAEISVAIRLVDGVQRVYLNGEDVSGEIRSPEVSMAASAVSAVPEVRAALLGIQRKIAEENDVIMDGRDIGTVVLPNADVKIFLTASPEVRAKRRCDELAQKGVEAKYEDVLADMQKRDYDDSHRQIAPLKMADGAVLADTSELDLEQAIELVCGIIENAVHNKLSKERG